MVYGVFDGFHEGHSHFLEQARQHCDALIIVVAHPAIVNALKQHAPLYSLPERINAIRTRYEACTVIAGDTEIGTWSALGHYQPDIVLLGYDQVRLGQELEKLGVQYTFITAHHPEKFKSSLLNKKDQADV